MPFSVRSKIEATMECCGNLSRVTYMSVKLEFSLTLCGQSVATSPSFGSFASAWLDGLGD